MQIYTILQCLRYKFIRVQTEGIGEGYKFGMCNVGVDGKKVTMPLYMAMFL